MSDIIIEHKPNKTRLDALDVFQWPTWSKEVSVFPWVFHEQEIAWILEGECVITPENGAPVKFGKGDLVTFPAGLKCNWEVRQPLHKHYHLDGSKLGQIARRVRAMLPF
ncbi:MAG TPA: cupin domain-containing protein [Methylophilaceae bacterium]|nr:cupin domain-containing protein [Methylophilaceae bacterium]HQR60752.1 cupin domain-containing protein [Methylophilaceae bacterium]